MSKYHQNHCKAAKKRESAKKTAESEFESEQVRETVIGASDQDYAWYLNRTVIQPEQFDRALQVENDFDQEKFDKKFFFGHFWSLFDHFWSLFEHFSVIFCCN